MPGPRQNVRSPKISPKTSLSEEEWCESSPTKSSKNIYPSLPKKGLKRANLDLDYLSDNSDDFDEVDRCATRTHLSDTSVASKDSSSSPKAKYSPTLPSDSETRFKGVHRNITRRKPLPHTKELKREYSCDEYKLKDSKNIIKPSGKNPDKNEKLKEEVRYIVRRVLGLSIACILLLFISWKYFPRMNVNMLYVKQERTMNDIHSDIKNGFRLLHLDFNQGKHFWVQLVSAVKDLMVSDPLSPAVLLTLVPRDSRGTSTCLLHNISRVMADAFGDSKFLMIDVSSIDTTDSIAFKHEVHSLLMELDTLHVALIHNLEKMPGDAAMIFHSFCDNENAPHKRVLFIMTLETSASYANLTSNNLEDTIEQYLTQLWTDTIRDVDVGAIKSRIANSPIIIKPEESALINRICPL